MSDITTPSLRDQIISAMNEHPDWHSYRIDHVPPDAVFDQAIMPLLQKAMDAGEIMLSRNTAPRIPIPTAVMSWIEGMEQCCKTVRGHESTISKRHLLTMLYSLGDSAQRALRDIKGSEG